MTNTANQSINKFIDNLNSLVSKTDDVFPLLKIIETYEVGRNGIVFHDLDNVWEREAFVVGKTLVLVSNLAQFEFVKVWNELKQDPKTQGLIDYVPFDTMQHVHNVFARYDIQTVKLFAPIYVDNLATLQITEVVRGEVKDSPVTRAFGESFAEFLQNHRNANLEDFDVDGWICDGDWSLPDGSIFSTTLFNPIDPEQCKGLLIAPAPNEESRSAHKNALSESAGASINCLVKQFISCELGFMANGLTEQEADREVLKSQTPDVGFLHATERARSFIGRKTGVEPKPFNDSNSFKSQIFYCIDSILKSSSPYQVILTWFRMQRTFKVRSAC